MRKNVITIAIGGLLFGAALTVAPSLNAQGCGLRYVAAGDAIPAGKEVSESERYPNKLMSEHLSKWGAWCEYDIAKDGTTSATHNTGGQLAQTWNYRPDLITLQVGEQNTTIKDLVGSCFDKVKSHDFSGASACAAAILGNTTLWSNLNSNLTYTFQQYRMMMSGRPKLVVAVLGYPNPYPKSSDALTVIPTMCAELQDTIPTCMSRWYQLPPALDLIDQVFKKMNETIQTAVTPFAYASYGRFVYVNTYDKLRDHCMKMEVSFKTQVYHPPNTYHQHDSSRAWNIGCSENWFNEGTTGYDVPFYLQPATTGVLTLYSQTTEKMGQWPDADGHKCMADLIWEADTIDPGTTPLKWKLGVPEAPKSDICQ